MKGSEFVFDCVDLLHYKYHKINLNHDGSNIGSLDCMKTKKQLNPVTKKDNRCFQYAVTVALNHEEIKKDL